MVQIHFLREQISPRTESVLGNYVLIRTLVSDSIFPIDTIVPNGGR